MNKRIEHLTKKIGTVDQFTNVVVDYNKPRDARAAVSAALDEFSRVVREHGAKDGLEWLLTIAMPLKRTMENNL